MCDNSSASLVTVRLLRTGFCAAYAVPSVTTTEPRHLAVVGAKGQCGRLDDVAARAEPVLELDNYVPYLGRG